MNDKDQNLNSTFVIWNSFVLGILTFTIEDVK